MNPLLRALEYRGPENRLTAALAELMTEPQICRAVLHEALGSDVASMEDFHVSPQAMIDGGYGDILIESRMLTVIIEAKIEAPFGTGQLERYAGFLQRPRASVKRHKSALIVLAPARYLDSLRREATEKLTPSTPEHLVHGLSWQRCAQVCAEVASSLDEEARVFARAFAAAVEESMGRVAEPLTRLEVEALTRDDTSNALRKAKALVEALVEELSGNKEVTVEPLRYGGFYWGCDCYWRRRAFWVGVWIDAWMKFGHGPLWVHIERKAFIPSGSRLNFSIQELAEGWAVPLPLYPDLPVPQQLQRTVERILTIVRLEDEKPSQS